MYEKLDYIHVNYIELNDRHCIQRQPLLELTNSKFRSFYSNSKIYKVMFSDGTVYVGLTCEDLETRHLSNKNSQVFKHKDKNPEIKLIVEAP